MHGAFCAVHYQRRTAKVILKSDKIGIRPLYYWEGKQFVVSATALRVLEGLAEVSKQMGVVGVTELVTLGYPLSSRTPD